MANRQSVIASKPVFLPNSTIISSPIFVLILHPSILFLLALFTSDLRYIAYSAWTLSNGNRKRDIHSDDIPESVFQAFPPRADDNISDLPAVDDLVPYLPLVRGCGAGSAL